MNEKVNRNNDEIEELQGLAQDLYKIPLPNVRDERKLMFKQELKSNLMFEFERKKREKYIKKRSFSIKIFRIFNHAAVTALALPLLIVGSVGTYAYYSPSVYGNHVLYPVKLSIEKIEYSFAKTPEAKAEKKLKLAKRRLQEIKVATSNGGALDKTLLSKVASYTLAAIQDVSEVKSEEKKQNLQKNIEVFAKDQMAVLIDIKDEYEEKKSEYVAYMDRKKNFGEDNKHQVFQNIDDDNDEMIHTNFTNDENNQYSKNTSIQDKKIENNYEDSIQTDKKEQQQELNQESDLAYDKYKKEPTVFVETNDNKNEKTENDTEISQSDFAYTSNEENQPSYNTSVIDDKKNYTAGGQTLDNNIQDDTKTSNTEYKEVKQSSEVDSNDTQKEKVIGTHDEKINTQPVGHSDYSSDFVYKEKEHTYKIFPGYNDSNTKGDINNVPIISAKDKNTIQAIDKDVEALQYLLDISDQVQEVNFANASPSVVSNQKTLYRPRIKFNPSLEKYKVEENVFLIQSSRPISFYLSHYFVDSFGIAVPANIYNKPVEIYYTKDNSDPFISKTKERYFEGQEILMDRNATLKFVAVVNGEASPIYVVQMNMIRKITNYELR